MMMKKILMTMMRKKSIMVSTKLHKINLKRKMLVIYLLKIGKMAIAYKIQMTKQSNEY